MPVMLSGIIIVVNIVRELGAVQVMVLLIVDRICGSIREPI